MKLYYAPGACSLASHIALQESGLHYDGVSVNLRDKKTGDGADFNTVNPKGYVPALVLDDGSLLTEGPALLAYIGELVPARQLIAAPGTLANYRVREWLIYISTELHKNMSPLFRPNTPDATREFQIAAVKRRLDGANDALAGKTYLTGEQFTVADAYLFTVLSWLGRFNLDLAQWPHLKAFYDRVKARPAVQKVLQIEGIAA
jgi:glutathione S-transferase